MRERTPSHGDPPTTPSSDAEERPGFGGLLRDHRVAAGLTQEELAERAGLGRRSIQRLEQSVGAPQRATLERLTGALRLSREQRAAFIAAAQPAPRPSGAAAVASGAMAVERRRQGGPRHNLPAQLTSFIGRERELADVKERLKTTRLLTLTGTGGCGKTRLALEVARSLIDSFHDDVWLIELAPLSDPALVSLAVLAALDKHEVPGEATIATLVSYLKLREALIVLDNCEHLIEACARLSETVLRVCPKVQILATSREMLGVAGEVAWRIPSLSVPDAEGPVTVQSLASFASVRLFVDRARAVRSDFRLGDANVSAVAQVVRRLDGIPLAIELAAARIRGLTAEEIVQRLDDRFRLLTGGSRTALRRQQTLRALVDWSYDLLSEDERTLLRRVSVFAGGFSLEAAEAVCGSAGADGPGYVLDLVLQLVDKSLVTAREQDSVTRYRLLETIRQYAGEKLLESGEASNLRSRHRGYFLDLAERAGPHLTAGDQKDWFDRLELEIDNIRSALDWNEAEPDVDRHLRLVGVLGRFWHVTGRNGEGWERLDVALRLEGWSDVRARALALHWAGRIAAAFDRWQDSRRLLEAAIALSRHGGDLDLLALALRHASLVSAALGHAERWRQELQEAIATAREAGNQRELAFGLLWQGLQEAWYGDRNTARRQIDEALGIAEGVGDAVLLGFAYVNLAALAIRGGDADGAERNLSALQQIAPSLGLRSLLQVWLLTIPGDIACLRGDLTIARESYAEALRLARRSGATNYRFRVLERWAAYCLASGDPRNSAVVLGCLGSFSNRAQIETFGFQELWVDPATAAGARQSLGEEAYAFSFAEGQRLTLEEMLECALASATPDSAPSP